MRMVVLVSVCILCVCVRACVRVCVSVCVQAGLAYLTFCRAPAPDPSNGGGGGGGGAGGGGLELRVYAEAREPRSAMRIVNRLIDLLMKRSDVC